MKEQEFFDNWNPVFSIKASGEPQEANRQFGKELNSLLESAKEVIKEAQREAWRGSFVDSYANDIEINKAFEYWYKQQNQGK